MIGLTFRASTYLFTCPQGMKIAATDPSRPSRLRVCCGRFSGRL